jgi:pimeloyl-ACP methyl ester carboxylesterase
MLIPGFLAGDQSLTRMAVSLRAVIVGQSRGGSIARAIAVLRQDLVKTVVTLGAPLLDQLAIRARTWPSVLGVGLLGTSGVPAC